jgi:hypothetical protein
MLLFIHMGMLSPEDIKLIGEEVGNVIEQNIMPHFDDLRAEMKQGFDRVDRRLETLDRSIGSTDGKVNSLINVLQDLHVITEDDKRRALS